MNELKKKKHYGKYRGIVTQPVDSGTKGRVTATVTIGGTPVPVVAEACTPFGGLGSGLYAIPPTGAGVWIEFEEGDLNKPIWTGSWWSDGELLRRCQRSLRCKLCPLFFSQSDETISL
jgi:hypothetical protein